MSVFVVGGDKIQTIKENLKEMGFNKINHVTGRRTRHRKIQVPTNTDLVLVLIDYVGHTVVESIKEQSKSHNTRIVYSRRAWTSIEKTLKDTIGEN
ncbi:DUF2325 domain-containing protein [Clostridium sporogenes]|jgi:hypothetical protein|uniref:DUF2325 domain-containing protein n=2 Tax=Clostridium TaxID=1485 RepID=A0A7X5SXJ7_CLOSG|nr:MULTISPECIES: DUF2325 domain-containing protein [Clostridium]AJD31162.1 hypothetical protein T258_2938 [Clostridium botulinum Prevot_594]AVP60651.1 DUF2325 domain-containing protein [Clostridium botulinum]AKC61106.1 hypothetical protein CLSPO_c03760 [Clostridium sporogenes]AKJ88457.1 dihydroorotate dehydrogenase [Clostridium sporogenes]AVP62789.1 DUF2325 domain-containing protein [Clostridium botulinum]